MQRHILKPMLAAVAILGATYGHQVSASPITWTTGATFDGLNGFQAISTWGKPVEAINLINTNDPNPGTLVVDPSGINIAFTPRSDIFNQPGFNTSGFTTTGDAAWDAIIRSVDYTSTGASTGTLNLTGLTVGVLYQVQLFSLDNRPVGNPLVGTEVIAFSDGLNNNSDPFDKGSATSIIGTFTADATTQSIILLDDDDHSLNAYVLRQVPTPSAFSLMLLGLGMLIKQRKQHPKSS